MERCKSIVNKHDDAHVKAEGERTLIKQALDVVNEELTTVLDELSSEKRTHQSLESKKNVFLEKLQKCNDNIVEFQVHEDNCRATENIQSSIVSWLCAGCNHI